MKCQQLLPPSPPPLPQLISGNEPNIPSPPSELHAGDEPFEGGSVKINDLNIAFIVAMQTLLPLLLIKFI